MAHGKDRRGKHFWQYQVKSSSGKIVLVRDYKYGKYRRPASVGLRDGGKTKAKGFFVKIRTVRDSEARTSVFIIQ